jgi:hypothetical protein
LASGSGSGAATDYWVAAWAMLRNGLGLLVIELRQLGASAAPDAQ